MCFQHEGNLLRLEINFSYVSFGSSIQNFTRIFSKECNCIIGRVTGVRESYNKGKEMSYVKIDCRHVL